MKKLKKILGCAILGIALTQQVTAQKIDSSKMARDNSPHVYFIITAGDKINAFYNDKPVQVSTIEEFNNYVQTYVKSMRDSWVTVTGKPKTGTFDEVMKTLKRNRFKHITTIIKD
jgi:hypothetical protein